MQELKASNELLKETMQSELQKHESEMAGSVNDFCFEVEDVGNELCQAGQDYVATVQQDMGKAHDANNRYLKTIYGKQSNGLLFGSITSAYRA